MATRTMQFIGDFAQIDGTVGTSDRDLQEQKTETYSISALRAALESVEAMMAVQNARQWPDGKTCGSRRCQGL